MPTPTIAVFTRNRLNPDHIEQQRALVEQATALRPHAAVFVPLHGERMDDWVKRILLTVQGVHRLNCDGHDRPLEQRSGPRWHDVVG